MSKVEFSLQISPEMAFSLVRENLYAKLIHSEYHEVETKKCIGTLIFEKYYLRTNNRAALIVIIDNLSDKTNARIVVAGSAEGEGIFFNVDWGAGDNFVSNVIKILEAHIIGELKRE